MMRYTDLHAKRDLRDVEGVGAEIHVVDDQVGASDSNSGVQRRNLRIVTGDRVGNVTFGEFRAKMMMKSRSSTDEQEFAGAIAS